ncbi:MAG TPA: cytochrome b [Rhodanobacter sp.]|nr:cytochrome b [Rhodanobacter sp.]HVC16255.1 cytochrome b [Rhodanobacter sp.]
MSSIDRQPRFAAPLRRMHWIMFALVLLAYLFINLFELFPKGSATRANILASHFLAGLAVLLLVLPRLWLRSRHARPAITPPPGHWEELLSKLTHAALYLFLLVQPILGVITLQVGGKPVTLFGVTVLPALLGAPDRALSHQLENIHGTIGEVFYYVIGLHILAALWHHYRRRDDTLKRML